MSALTKDGGFAVQGKSNPVDSKGVFREVKTSSGSVRVMNRKTFDEAVKASNRYIQKTIERINER